MGKSLGRKPDTETVIGRAARYHNQGTSAEMIAERLGVQIGTVRVYLSRARHRGLIKGRSDPGDDLRFLMLNLPQPIVQRLADVLNKSLAAPDLRERFATLGAEPWVATAKELDNRVRLDFDRLGKVIKAAGIQPE